MNLYYKEQFGKIKKKYKRIHVKNNVIATRKSSIHIENKAKKIVCEKEKTKILNQENKPLRTLETFLNFI